MKHSRGLKLFYNALFLLILVFFGVINIYAQTLDELEKKISEKGGEIAQIEQQIRAYQLELNSISTQKNSLANQIKQLDLTKKKLTADIMLTEKKIESTNLKIRNLNLDINTKEISISNNQKVIATGLRAINEMETSNLFLSGILTSRNFSQIWTEIDQIASLHERISIQSKELKNTKLVLTNHLQKDTEARKELEKLYSELADQRKITDQNAKEKNALLNQTKNSEANYQKLLKEQNDKKLAIEQELRDFESRLKFILDPSALPNAGVLSWPLDNVYVTQLFGRTVAAQRLYASGSHSGVDFRASVGTPVKAMAKGIVKGVGDTDTTCKGASFGKWIFVEFDNGLSATYAHLSLAKVTPGQNVTRGEVLGYSGATGRVTGPHLHITLYASGAASVQTVPSKACAGKILTQPLAPTNAYLDPMIYLPPYNN